MRWESRLVRVFNQRREQIALHALAEPGKFTTDPLHQHSPYRHVIHRNLDYLLDRSRLIRQTQRDVGRSDDSTTRPRRHASIAWPVGPGWQTSRDQQLPKNSGEHLFEVIMRRYENRSTIMTSNRPLEEWGKLLGDVPTAGAILDRFLHHAQTIAIAGRSYRLKDHAAIAGKEDKNKKAKSKPNEPSAAEPAS